MNEDVRGYSSESHQHSWYAGSWPLTRNSASRRCLAVPRSVLPWEKVASGNGNDCFALWGNSRLTLPFCISKMSREKGWQSVGILWFGLKNELLKHIIAVLTPYARLEIGVLQDVEQEICPPLCSTFHGKIMGQNGVQAKLCVRKTIVDSSIQAQFAGDFTRQKWWCYGIPDNTLAISVIYHLQSVPLLSVRSIA